MDCPSYLRSGCDPQPAPLLGSSEEKEMGSISPAQKSMLVDELSPPPIVISPESEEALIITPTPDHEPTPVSGDVLLPLMIFSAVKSNPPHLLYIQRFWNRAVGGEESYCLINLMAAAEFLENADLAHLGLAGGDEISTADLSPIPVLRSRSRSLSIGSCGSPRPSGPWTRGNSRCGCEDASRSTWTRSRGLRIKSYRASWIRRLASSGRPCRGASPPSRAVRVRMRLFRNRGRRSGCWGGRASF